MLPSTYSLNLPIRAAVTKAYRWALISNESSVHSIVLHWVFMALSRSVGQYRHHLAFSVAFSGIILRRWLFAHLQRSAIGVVDSTIWTWSWDGHSSKQRLQPYPKAVVSPLHQDLLKNYFHDIFCSLCVKEVVSMSWPKLPVKLLCCPSVKLTWLSCYCLWHVWGNSLSGLQSIVNNKPLNSFNCIQCLVSLRIPQGGTWLSFSSFSVFTQPQLDHSFHTALKNKEHWWN